MIILSNEEERVGSACVEAAYQVHKRLGPGLVERVYEVCFCHELAKLDIEYQRQVRLNIKYDDLIFTESLRLDVLAGDLVICEIKARDVEQGYWNRQLRSQLLLSGRRLGFLINFNVEYIKNGIKRSVVG
jgi:GxxExxY protein